MTPTDSAALWSIGAGVVSLILAVIAIWLSLYFYTRGKDTERAVTNALAEIKAQTAALERLSAKQLDRLTKFATEGRPTDPAITEVARTFREISLHIMQPAPSGPSPSASRLQADLLLANFQSLYFAGLLNIVMAAGLPHIDPADTESYGWVCGVIEQSYMFFKNAEGALRQIDLTPLQQNNGVVLAREVLDDIAPLLRNVLMAQQSDATD